MFFLLKFKVHSKNTKWYNEYCIYSFVHEHIHVITQESSSSFDLQHTINKHFLFKHHTNTKPETLCNINCVEMLYTNYIYYTP